MRDPDLYRCPFCRNDKSEFFQKIAKSVAPWSVRCRKCCAHGPARQNKKAAAEEWNYVSMVMKLKEGMAYE
jgi:hypothetical protein